MKINAALRNLILTISLSIYIPGCIFLPMDFVDGKLIIINKSDKRIGVTLNYDYPDTSFIYSHSNTAVSSRDSSHVKLLNRKWDYFFKKQKYLTLFYVNEDSLEKYPGGKWRENILPLKKVILDKPMLDSLGWTLYYP